MAEQRRTSLAGPDTLPAARGDVDLRAHLPGLEPERRVNDWGRSERIEGVLDRTAVEFLYRYWFRVEVEGIDHVPSDGGAPLVSTHSRALPPPPPAPRGAARWPPPPGAPPPPTRR